jgi:hypothetical protein
VVWWRAAGMSRVDRGCGWPKNRRGTKKLQRRQASQLGAMGSGQGVLRECCPVYCPSGGAGGATDVLAMRSAG